MYAVYVCVIHWLIHCFLYKSVSMYCLYVNCFCTVWSMLSRISITKAHVLWWCDNKSDLIWFDLTYMGCASPQVRIARKLNWQGFKTHANNALLCVQGSFKHKCLKWLSISAVSHKCNPTAEITFDVNVCSIVQYINTSAPAPILCAVVRYYNISSKAWHGDILIVHHQKSSYRTTLTSTINISFSHTIKSLHTIKRLCCKTVSHMCYSGKFIHRSDVFS